MIMGTHAASSGGTAISASGAITPTIAANSIQSPGAGASTGIFISSMGATLRRNRVIGHDKGLVVSNPTGEVTMSSDLIAKSATRGIDISGGGTTVDADNITVIDNVLAWGDIEVGSGTGLVLDSSIVGGGSGANGVNGIDVEGGGAGCTISDSRGTGDSAFSSSCGTGFVEHRRPDVRQPRLARLRLPPVGGIADDRRGQHPRARGRGVRRRRRPARALPGADLPGPPRHRRRRVRAATPGPTTCPLTPTPPAPAAPPATKKKCKKGRKLKKGKCVKKKKKRKK